jgi:hypothetical protein
MSLGHLVGPDMGVWALSGPCLPRSLALVLVPIEVTSICLQFAFYLVLRGVEK